MVLGLMCRSVSSSDQMLFTTTCISLIYTPQSFPTSTDVQMTTLCSAEHKEQPISIMFGSKKAQKIIFLIGFEAGIIYECHMKVTTNLFQGGHYSHQ